MNIVRVEPGFFEADEDGYMQASEEAGPDGRAKGFEVVLYVQDPGVQITHAHSDYVDGFQFTEHELELWPAWIQERYPQADWNFDSDEGGEASFYDEFRPGEGNHELMMRLAVNNRYYNKIRNECCILYVMLFNFITHCQNIRREVTSGVGWPE